jgi:hypothetical protein
MTLTELHSSAQDEPDITTQLCNQLNQLVIEDIPEKQQVIRYALDNGNSNAPASDQERRAAYKKLVGPCPYVQVADPTISSGECI